MLSNRNDLYSKRSINSYKGGEISDFSNNLFRDRAFIVMYVSCFVPIDRDKLEIV